MGKAEHHATGPGHPPLRALDHGEHPNRAGNKRLKNALFQSAFAALADPESRAYYDRKIAEKKKHNVAIICLARRRLDVIHAMLRDGTYHQPKHPAAA